MTLPATGIDLQTVGVILMVVGVAGLVLSFIFWSSWGGGRARRRSVVERRDRVVRGERSLGDDRLVGRSARTAASRDDRDDIDKAA
jgi:hypothetical protein